MTQKIRVDGMNCGHCAMSVREALTAVQGVSAVEVDLESGIAQVESDRDIPQDAYAKAIDTAGYTFVSAG